MNTQDVAYKVLSVSMDELAHYPNGIEQIYEGEIDGFLVKNVLTTEEIKKAVDRIYEKHQSFTSFSSFSVLDENNHFLGCEDDLDVYLKKAQQNTDYINNLFDIDLKKRFEKVFQALAQDKTVSIPTKEDTPYKGYIVRVCSEGGGFQAHVGNQFVETMTGYQHLNQIAELYNQLSFFTVLQSPEEGGELVLYNLTWENTPVILKADKSTNPGQRHGVVERFYKQVEAISPQQGDVLIFAGGKIWHKVNDVVGKTDRITLGGFLGKSKDGKTLFYWS